VEGRVLSIAGSDSGGGAGIQADVKTITALGGYAATAITLLTAQNTLGVAEVQSVDPFFVERQVEVVLTDIGADAVKLGALASPTTAELVARILERLARSVPVVVDPVMHASSGGQLSSGDTLDVVRRRLLPACALLTPNVPEAEALTGLTITDEAGLHRAADALLLAGASAVLVTGGHLTGETVVDLLRTVDGAEHRFEGERQETRARHGTGCTLSAAIATGLAQGMTLYSSVARAIEFVQQAMRWATPLGTGPSGPLDHGFCLRQRPREEPVH
jgi:hydroxymethylpyrimidine/phosphomethylpyrimidine kinase